MTVNFVTPLNMEIRTLAERETAMSLVQKLSGALEDTPEQTRLLMLIDAIETWDNKPAPQRGDGNTSPLALMPTLTARE